MDNVENGTLAYAVPATSAGLGVFDMVWNSTGGYFCVAVADALDFFINPTYMVEFLVKYNRSGVTRRLADNPAACYVC